MSEQKITLQDIRDTYQLRVCCGRGGLQRPVTGAYVGDLLSDVMSHAQPGYIWITVQCHPNIAAVAKLKRLSGIVLINDRQPDTVTVKKAEKEGIPVFSSSLSSYELAGRLYEQGVRP
jgi:hypothetical protein